MAKAGARVWDVPTRLFHWSLALLVIVSWRTAESGALDWHYRSGLLLIGLVTFRVLWGFFGSSTARFASFVKGPAAIRAYLRGSVVETPGHSPIGGLSVMALLGLVALQIMLGLFALDDDGLFEGPLAQFVSIKLADSLTEIHEILFNVLAGFIILHILAILFYRIKGRKLIPPMITGVDPQLSGAPSIPATDKKRAILCAAASALLVAAIYWIGS